MNIVEFIAKWKKVELKERSAAQEHCMDLCHCFGHPTPAEADPTGATFCLEKHEGWGRPVMFSAMPSSALAARQRMEMEGSDLSMSMLAMMFILD